MSEKINRKAITMAAIAALWGGTIFTAAQSSPSLAPTSTKQKPVKKIPKETSVYAWRYSDGAATRRFTIQPLDLQVYQTITCIGKSIGSLTTVGRYNYDTSSQLLRDYAPCNNFKIDQDELDPPK